jgi:hypothetical protein
MSWKLAGSAAAVLLLLTYSGTLDTAQAGQRGGAAHFRGGHVSGGMRSFSPSGVRAFPGAGARPLYGGGVHSSYRVGPQHFAFQHQHFHHDHFHRDHFHQDHFHQDHFRHHRFRGSPFIALGAYPLYSDYGYYENEDGCYWFKQQALYTGNPYWWSRYEDCHYDENY